LLQGLHRVTLLAFDEAMQEQHLSVGAKVEDDAN